MRQRSAPAAHRSADNDTNPRASAESDFQRGNDTAGRRALDPQRADEDTAPLLRSVIYPANAAGGIRCPAELSQRIDDEPDERIDATGDARLAARPRLSHRAHDAQPHIRACRNAQADTDVRRRRARSDEIGTGFGLDSRSRLLAVLLRFALVRRNAKRETRQ